MAFGNFANAAASLGGGSGNAVAGPDLETIQTEVGKHQTYEYHTIRIY